MPYEKAVQEASAKFREALTIICTQAMDKRDATLLQTIGMMDGKWREGFRGAQQLGELHPAWLEYRNSDPMGALSALAEGLAGSMYARQHRLAQAAVREVSFQRQLIQKIPTTAMELPAARRLLGEADVRKLRAGEPIILDPHLLLSLVTDEQMRHVHADLSRLVRSMAVASGSPCNHGAQTGFLPLFDGTNGNDNMHADDTAAGSFAMHADTRALLRVIASLPAEIERHGWPRPLSLPAFVQLACYSARNRAHYTPHLDRWEHETHNRREITILCYVNPAWEPRVGGCLRLHPNPLGSAPTVDVEPLCGRIVIFPSATQQHEVLQCTKGERLALTLWVDYADVENGNAIRRRG